MINDESKLLRCTSHCTAESYCLDALIAAMRSDGFAPNLFDNVVHVSFEEAEWTYEMFFFDYGCYVLWASDVVTGSVLSSIHRWVRHAEVRPVQRPIEDMVYYVYGEETHIVEEEDTLFLEQDHLINLAMSHALSQSVKLRSFELAIMDSIEVTRQLTVQLENEGKTSLSHQGLAQMVGHLFAARQSINLHTDILDTPEFFWRRPKYERYYGMVSSFLDLATRISILNRRLDVIQELYQMLSDELRHEHSSRLEWIVIILIMLEVVVGVLHIAKAI